MATSLIPRLSRALSPFFDRNPFSALEEELDDLLNRYRSEWNGDGSMAVIAPPLDLSETEDAFQIRMNLPGVKAEEVDIQISENTLRISGEHKEEKEEKGKTFHRLERRIGSFSRSLTLPAAVQADKVSAECKDGVLTVNLPKCEATKTQKIKVHPK